MAHAEIIKDDSYAFHHNRVKEGMKGLYSVAESLFTIREEKLYKKAGYKTFAEYCEAEHGLGKSQAYRHISSFQVQKQLDVSPEVARHLSRVPEGSRKEVLETAKQRVEDDSAISQSLVMDINDEIIERAVDNEVEDAIKSTKGDIDLWDIRQLMQTIQRALNDLKVVQELPCGAHLPVNRVETDLLNAKEAVKLAVPDTQCPICNGPGCKFCNKIGWVPASLAKVAEDRYA